jgi:hypothetical protein
MIKLGQLKKGKPLLDKDVYGFRINIARKVIRGVKKKTRNHIMTTGGMVENQETGLLVRKENEELRRQIAIIPNKRMDDLHPREKKTVDYVEKNPGTNKEEIISYLTNEGIGSRMTIRKAIANLIEYGMISQRRATDKPNNQVLELYINEDSVFLSVYRELDKFKNLFFDRIEKIRQKDLDQNTWVEIDALLVHLVYICLHVLGAYLFYFFLRWPTQIYDVAIRNKLYAIIIYRIVEIQSKLSEVFFIKSTAIQKYYSVLPSEIDDPAPILATFCSHMGVLKPDTIVKILEDYKKCNAHEEIIPLIDSAWKIGCDAYLWQLPLRTVLPEDFHKLQNFRLAIEAYTKERNLKVSSEIWEVLEPLRKQQHE